MPNNGGIECSSGVVAISPRRRIEPLKRETELRDCLPPARQRKITTTLRGRIAEQRRHCSALEVRQGDPPRFALVSSCTVCTCDWVLSSGRGAYASSAEAER